MLSLQISSSLRDIVSERRFQKDLTIANLKGKLEVITGGTASMMNLEVYSEQNKLICKLDEDSNLLGSYPIEDNMRLHVINTDPSKILGVFDDVSKVEKFEMDQSDYEKKTDSVLAFKKRNKLGRFGDKDPLEQDKKEEALRKEEEKAKAITINSRCLVTRSGVPARKGVVRFAGTTEFAGGWWIGVQYDEPFGKNDGSVNGKRYFECPPKYGAFVKPSCVETGDFPEDDFDDDDEM